MDNTKVIVEIIETLQHLPSTATTIDILENYSLDFSLEEEINAAAS